MTLRLDFCTRDAAAHAVKHWHYSHTMPVGKMVTIGVWEESKFIGAIIFSRGAQPAIGAEFGLTQLQCVELTRIALTKHIAPVSRMISIALSIFKKVCPGILAVLSYADSDQKHLGGIYQASNWIYLGQTELKGGTAKYLIHGKLIHGRSIASKYGTRKYGFIREHVDPDFKLVPTLGKQKYIWVFDPALRAKLQAKSQPYPKICGIGVVSDTSGDHSEEGGATPTMPLPLKKKKLTGKKIIRKFGKSVMAKRTKNKMTPRQVNRQNNLANA